MTKTTLAYLAGALDSDGMIAVRRNTYSMRVVGDSAQPSYSERIGLKQVTPQVPALLHECFGGYLSISDPTAKRGRPLHSWQVTDKKAVECLRAVLPYLIVKRAQADNCLELRKLKERSKKARVARGRGHVGAATRPVELSEAMEACYLRSRELNRVGVQLPD